MLLQIAFFPDLFLLVLELYDPPVSSPMTKDDKRATFFHLNRKPEQEFHAGSWCPMSLLFFLYILSGFICPSISSHTHADTYWQPHMHSRQVPLVQSHSRLRVSRRENRIQNWTDELGTKNKPAAALKRNRTDSILWNIALWMVILSVLTSTRWWHMKTIS